MRKLTVFLNKEMKNEITIFKNKYSYIIVFSMVPCVFCWEKCNNFQQWRQIIMFALGNRNVATRFK